MKYRYRQHEGEITDTAEAILQERYYQPGEDFGGLCRRVAEHVGAGDDEHDIDEEFYWLLRSLDFLPNSPTLMNAGTDQGTLSACFVLPVDDTMEGITYASHTQAMVQKFGGGTGFSLSDLRPKGSPIASTHGKACGPVAVLRYLSATSTLVTQGGKRDGANMAVLRVDHPDIMEFIRCKQKEGDIHNFNISVGMTDAFLSAVKRNAAFELEFDGIVHEVVRAADIWEAITEGAWRNGEPGAVFLDRVNDKHPASFVGEITATNPCGEQPLLPYESCNLGSINLTNFYSEDGADFDWIALSHAVRLATRFLDDTITMNHYATREIQAANKRTRKIGLGVMGWADALSYFAIPYDSEEALALARELMHFIHTNATAESQRIAADEGVYPALADRLDVTDPEAVMRNACVTSIAPTGTISMIAGVSSGIEPHFSLAYTKQNILDGRAFTFVNNAFEETLWDEDSLLHHEVDAILAQMEEGKTAREAGAPEDICDIFKTAGEIHPNDHVQMQAAFQLYVDSGVSKTINLPNSATKEDVKMAYLNAWKSNCKGITVYRQGSREKEVLVSAGESPPSPHFSPATRPESLPGRTVRVNTGRGKAYITLNEMDNALREVFIVHGKAGGNDAAMAQALSRLLGVSLQYGIPVDELAKPLMGITDIVSWDNGRKILSMPDAVGQTLHEWGGDVVVHMPRDCGEGQCNIAEEEGCFKCYTCGWSEC